MPNHIASSFSLHNTTLTWCEGQCGPIKYTCPPNPLTDGMACDPAWQMGYGDRPLQGPLGGRNEGFSWHVPLTLPPAKKVNITRP